MKIQISNPVRLLFNADKIRPSSLRPNHCNMLQQVQEEQTSDRHPTNLLADLRR